jgi:hypothetical protein
MLEKDPKKRPSTEDILAHPCIKETTLKLGQFIENIR